MDIYNTRKFLKTSEIDDRYWKRSWHAMGQLLSALKGDSEKEILKALSNPSLFEGRS